jgi:hypothetical protein
VYPTGAYILKRKKGLLVTRDCTDLPNNLPVTCNSVFLSLPTGGSSLAVIADT